MIIWLLRVIGVVAALGAVVVAGFAARTQPRDADLGAVQSWFLANLPLVGLWIVALALALVSLYGFRAAARFRRIGLGLADEDSKLRNDPRFTEVWVQHLKTQAPPKSGTTDQPPVA